MLDETPSNVSGNRVIEGEEEEAQVNPQMATITIPVPDVAPKNAFAVATGESLFRIGIVIDSLNTIEPSIAGISHPVCPCAVTCVAVLEPSPQSPSAVETWFRNHKLGSTAKDICILWGDEGFQTLVQNPNVDAMYVIVPTEVQRKYVLAALDAGKHVLLKDHVSTSLDQFIEQLEHAVRLNKFVQFSTTFVHQYRVKKFLDCILREDIFGPLRSVNATLQLSYDDMHLVGAKLPLAPDQGAIRRLGRYCVLFSVLVFARVGSTATSVKVNKIEMSGTPEEAMSANCTVNFTDNRQLTFDIAYSNISATRQHIQVQSESRYACMSDFVFPNRDGLATYIVYERGSTPGGKPIVVGGEAINIASGPPQKVIMWKDFCELSRRVDQSGGWVRSPETAVVRELALVTTQTKLILNALRQSFMQGNIEIDIAKDLAAIRERFEQLAES